MKYIIKITRQDLVEINASSEEQALETLQKILLQKNPKDVFTLDVVTEITP